MPEPEKDDLVKLLRMRAHFATSDGSIEISETLEWLAAEEIIRLRDTVEGLLGTLKQVQQMYPYKTP
jgi:hypothetical protein